MSVTRVYSRGTIPGITLEKISGDPGTGGNLTGKGNARYRITWSGDFTLTPKQAAVTKGYTISERRVVIFGWIPDMVSMGGTPFVIEVPASST